jgi:hypothetical protein
MAISKIQLLNYNFYRSGVKGGLLATWISSQKMG